MKFFPHLKRLKEGKSIEYWGKRWNSLPHPRGLTTLEEINFAKCHALLQEYCGGPKIPFSPLWLFTFFRFSIRILTGRWNTHHIDIVMQTLQSYLFAKKLNSTLNDKNKDESLLDQIEKNINKQGQNLNPEGDLGRILTIIRNRITKTDYEELSSHSSPSCTPKTNFRLTPTNF